MMIIGTEGALGLPTAYDNQGWTGKLFFSQGGAGLGRAWPKIYGGGPARGTSPSPQCGAGRGRGQNLRGEEGLGRGTYCIYQLIEIMLQQSKSYSALH